MSDNERDGHSAPAEDDVKVTDRRLFTADGTLRSDLTDEAADERESEPAGDAAEPTRQEAEQGFEHRPVEEPEGVDFTMLINAMAEPALLFLGEIAHPATGKPTVDLQRARLQIDMLDLLRVKCRGNLTSEEDSLLDRILYQLRMRYVARAGEAEP